MGIMWSIVERLDERSKNPQVRSENNQKRGKTTEREARISERQSRLNGRRLQRQGAQRRRLECRKERLSLQSEIDFEQLHCNHEATLQKLQNLNKEDERKYLLAEREQQLQHQILLERQDKLYSACRNTLSKVKKMDFSQAIQTAHVLHSMQTEQLPMQRGAHINFKRALTTSANL